MTRRNEVLPGSWGLELSWALSIWPSCERNPRSLALLAPEPDSRRLTENLTNRFFGRALKFLREPDGAGLSIDVATEVSKHDA
jgi:hypothetical protein